MDSWCGGSEPRYRKDVTSSRLWENFFQVLHPQHLPILVGPLLSFSIHICTRPVDAGPPGRTPMRGRPTGSQPALARAKCRRTSHNSVQPREVRSTTYISTLMCEGEWQTIDCAHALAKYCGFQTHGEIVQPPRTLDLDKPCEGACLLPDERWSTKWRPANA